MAGFERSRGSQIILTLPAYHQIEAAEIEQAGRRRSDRGPGRRQRWPRAGGPFEHCAARPSIGLLAWITGMRLQRPRLRRPRHEAARARGNRAVRRSAPLPARARRSPGFRVREVDVRQSPRDRFEGIYRPREYAHRVLDIFTVFFLVRFTKKPLRFFGMIGVSTFGLGALLAAVARRSSGCSSVSALADRPALLLSSLLLVLGLQLFALGLLGELIIFTHARDIKDYQVEAVIEFDDERRDGELDLKPAGSRF